MPIPLIAHKAFPYAGVPLQPGVTFLATPEDARILKALQWAVDAPVEDVAEAEAPVRRRRSSRRVETEAEVEE